jgi:hypothetical protein
MVRESSNYGCAQMKHELSKRGVSTIDSLGRDPTIQKHEWGFSGLKIVEAKPHIAL